VASECDRFGRYLTGASTPSYVREWYEDGVTRFSDRFAPRSRLDGVLLAMSTWPWLPLRAVDMAARFLQPGGTVRRRLVFLTAVLENAPETFERYEAPDTGSPVRFFVGLAGRGIVSALALIVGLFFVGLARLAGVGR